MPRGTIAEFSIDHIQILNEAGVVDDTLLPALSDDALITMYRVMRLSRRFDERAIALQRRGEIGTYAPTIGQEAAQVGSALALTDADWMVPSFREQGAYLARGTPVHKLLWYAMGMEEGAEIPRDAHALPPSIPVGSQALHAAGIGWGQEIKNEDAASLVYFGDGATSEGDVYEALNFAGVYNSHTVFLCQNNQYAISTPRVQQTKAATLAQKAVAAGIDGIQIDGNDILGVFATTQDALARAREGNPVLIEAVTYRRSMHTTADDPSVYRTPEEEAEWAERDPIDRFETFLLDRNLLTSDRIAAINDDIEAELEAGIEAAKEGQQAVDPADMFRFVFADLSPELERQLQEYQEATDGE